LEGHTDTCASVLNFVLLSKQDVIDIVQIAGPESV